MENRFGQGPIIPVKVGEELDVTIEAVGEKGDGIAKRDGFVLFVPNTKENQRVRIKVTKVLRRVGFAEVVGDAGAAPAGEAVANAEPTPEDSEDFGEEAPAEESEDSVEEESADEPLDEPVEETEKPVEETEDAPEDEEKKE